MQAKVFKMVHTWKNNRCAFLHNFSLQHAHECLTRNTMRAHTVNCPSKCVRNYHDGWNSLTFMWNKKEENKGQMWDCCFKCVCKQMNQPRAKDREESPLRLGFFNNHSSRDDGCKRTLWAQLAKKGLDSSLVLGQLSLIPQQTQQESLLIFCPLHFSTSPFP